MPGIDNPVLGVVIFVALLLPSVILHEVAHGWVAERLGDPTARRSGRLTLNPVRHIDVFGSIILPALLALARAPVFGWAKPVPVNPRVFRRPIEGMALVAFAGPVTNLVLALIAGRLLVPNLEGIPQVMAFAFAFLNVVLAVFNLLPIPPLDGSRVLRLFLPPAGRAVLARIEPYGILIIFAAFFLFEEAFSFLFPVVERVTAWVIG